MCFNVYAVVCTYVAFCKDVLLFLQDSKKYFKRADLTQRNTSKGLISREKKRKNIIGDVDTRYKLQL